MQGLLWLGEERWERGKKQKSGFPWKTNRLLFQSAERERERRLSGCLSVFCGSRWRKRQFQKLHKHIQKPPRALRLWGGQIKTLWINNQSQGEIMLAEALQLVYSCPIWKITKIWHGIQHKVQAEKVYGFSNIQKQTRKGSNSWLTNVMLCKHGFSRVTADWTVYNVHYYHSVRGFDVWKTFGKF